MKLFYGVYFLFMTSLASSTPTSLTRDVLLNNCDVPDKRSFPISSKIQPCQNYYKYICEETVNSFELPEHRSSYLFSFSDGAKKLDCARENFFKLAQNKYKFNSTKIEPAVKYFSSCLDKQNRGKGENSFIKLALIKIKEIKSKEEILNSMAKNMKTWEPSIVSFHITPGQDDPSKYDLFFMPSFKFFPDRSYLTKESSQDFLSFVETFFRSVGYGENVKKMAKLVLEYEKHILENSMNSQEFREIINSSNYIDHKRFFAYKNLKLNEFYKLVPEDIKTRDLFPKTLQFLNDWLEVASLDELKAVYLFYGYNNYLDEGYKDFLTRKLKFYSKYLGQAEKRSPIFERCSGIVSDRYGMEIDAEIIDILFPDFPREKVEKLAENVRAALLDGIKKNTWLRKNTKKEAVKKIEHANLLIAKPRNESEWDFFPSLDLSNTNFIRNNNLIVTAEKEKWLRLLKTRRSKNRWVMNPLIASSYYMPSDNTFALMQGNLQPPMYDPQKKDIENYASLGSTVAHELGHAIDDQLSKYDYMGRFRPWMTDSDIKKFKERSTVFIERMDKIGHNGKLTLGETIGDHVGLVFAYEAAFKDSVEADIKNKRLFFEAYAKLWCQKTRDNWKKQQLKTAKHPLGFARVNEQVIHLDGFYEAYQCKKGDAMYITPENRVRVW